MQKSIVVCDQMQLFREGIARVLESFQFDVTLCVRSPEEIVYDRTIERKVDVIILGVNEEASFEQAALGLRVAPGDGPLLVVLATSPTRELIRNAIDFGIRAVLSKDISGEILSSAIKLVLVGHKFYPAYNEVSERETKARPASMDGHIAAANDRMQIRLTEPGGADGIQLSEREEQILCRLISGAPNKSIARDLAITDSTVKVHIKGLLRKLRVTNRTQAAIWGVNYGYSGDRRFSKRVNGDAAPVNVVRAAS